MPTQTELLKLQYGSGAIPIKSDFTNGTMYVHTSTINTENDIYDAKLYFDLGGKRYCIQGDKLSSLGTLGLILGNDIDVNNNIIIDNLYSGTSGPITWTIPYASTTSPGLVSLLSQTFTGEKTFSNTTTFNDNIIARVIMPTNGIECNIGSNIAPWGSIYATNFYGNLTGNATTATTADKTVGALTINKSDESNSLTFNGQNNLAISIYNLTDSTGKLPLGVIPAGALERVIICRDLDDAKAKILAGTAQPGDLIRFDDTQIMYYVQDLDEEITSENVNNTLVKFRAGVAAQAESVVGTLEFQINGVLKNSYNGSGYTAFNIPLAGANIDGGLISNATQTIVGNKTFNDAIIFSNTTTFNNTISASNINPIENETYNLGTSSLKWTNVYANFFYGDLKGNADTATQVNSSIEFNNDPIGIPNNTISFNGFSPITIGSFKPAELNTENEQVDGLAGFVPSSTYAERVGFLRGTGKWVSITANRDIQIIENNNLVDNSTNITIGHSNNFNSLIDITDNPPMVAKNNLFYSADTVDVDAHGHITGVFHNKLDFTNAVIPTSEYSEGDHIATILDVPIYAGIAWGTF